MWSRKIITIDHECSYRIEISHLRGQNFNQGRGLSSPWFNSDTKGEISLFYIGRLMISLSYMGRLMIDLSKVFCWNIKSEEIVNIFTCRIYINSDFTSVLIG